VEAVTLDSVPELIVVAGSSMGEVEAVRAAVADESVDDVRGAAEWGSSFNFLVRS